MDIVFAAKTNHHQVEQLRPNQNGEDHSGHLRRLAHHRAQNARAEQGPTGIEQPKERIEIGGLSDEKRNPAFHGHRILPHTQIKIHPDQEHNHQCKGRTDDDLGRFILIF